MKYHIALADQPQGPYTLEELRRLQIQPDTLVWTDGMADWQPASGIAELRGLLAGAAPSQAEEDDAASDVFEVKIPDEPQRVQPVTPYPHAYPPQQAPAPGGALQYSMGYGPIAGALPVGMAVTSMVLGIIALLLSFLAFCLWFFSGPLAITAIIFGHVARSNANRGVAGGGGMALAGLICGYFALALTAFFLLGFLGLMATA